MSEETPESIAETNGHLLGISTGWGEAADFLLDTACAAFRVGHDDMAHQLRDQARALRDKAAEKRKDYDAHKMEYDEHKDEEG